MNKLQILKNSLNIQQKVNFYNFLHINNNTQIYKSLYTFNSLQQINYPKNYILKNFKIQNIFYKQTYNFRNFNKNKKNNNNNTPTNQQLEEEQYLRPQINIQDFEKEQQQQKKQETLKKTKPILDRAKNMLKYFTLSLLFGIASIQIVALILDYRLNQQLEDELVEVNKEIENEQKGLKRGEILNKLYLKKAKLCIQFKQNHKAEETLQEVVSRYKGDKDINTTFAQIKALQRKYDDAIQYANYALQVDSNHKDAYQILSECYLQQNKIILSMKSADKYLEVDPLSEIGYKLKGDIQLKMKEINDSLIHYDYAININPDLKKLFDLKETVFDTLSDKLYDDQKASQVMTDEMMLNRMRSLIYLRSCCTFIYTDNLKKAEEQIDKALELDSNFVEIYYTAAQLYFQAKKFEKSLEFLKECEETGEETSKIPFLQGIIYKKLNQNKQAFDHFQKALALEQVNHKYNGRYFKNLIENEIKQLL